MKYKVRFIFDIDVEEADSSSDAREIAEKKLHSGKVIGCSVVKDMETYEKEVKYGLDKHDIEYF